MPSAILTLIQYCLAFLVIFMILPRFMFASNDQGAQDFWEGFYVYFSKMVLAVIVIGYLLVFARLFEFISVMIVFLAMILRKYYFAKPMHLRHRTFKEIRAWLSDYAEGIIDLPGVLLRKVKEKVKAKEAGDRSGIRFISGISGAFIAGGYVLFIRLYDSFVNAAPAMSDAYVTLAWIKYINNRILFHDGIYPQGYYIYQAFLQKFSGLDPVYVLRYTGPIVSALIALGIYFTVSGLLKCKYSGALAAIAYGLFGSAFTGSWERQAASNSQEFGFLFIMPAIYFFYKYAKSGERKDLVTAGATLMVIGLVHALAFVYAMYGIVLLAAAILLTDLSAFRRVALKSVAAALISAVTALIPIAVGFAMGKSLHSASAEFAVSAYTSGSVPVFPTLRISDYIALGCILLVLIIVPLVKEKDRKTALLFLALFGAGSFALYYFGGYVTGSLVIEARARELFSIASPVIAGAGFWGITSVFRRDQIRYDVRLASVYSLVIALFIVIRPAPIIPYKMEYNSFIEQYLRIAGSYRPTEWLIVSQEEGYALAYGKGWHLMVGDFLDGAVGSSQELISGKDGDSPIEVPHVFIFHEKQIYETYFAMKELEKQRERRISEKDRLGVWISDYKESGGEISLFYDDQNISVYHIEQSKAYENLGEKVIGPKR